MARLRSKPTLELAEFAATAKFEDLPAEVVDRAKLTILDWLGAALSGYDTKFPRALIDIMCVGDSKGPSTIIASGRKTAPLVSALINGVMSSVQEVDDVHSEVSMHPAVAVIPSALAIAEELETGGRELILAIVLGYDVALRVGKAAGVSHYKKWHMTGTCGTFGASISAGKILGLNTKQMLGALGLAGTQAAGLWEGITKEGISAKYFHGGRAAHNGLLAALMAEKGLAGGSEILEGEKGFLRVMTSASEEDIRQITHNIGKEFLICRNFFKPYACCSANFDAITATLAILKKHELDPEDIEAIQVSMSRSFSRIVNNSNPRNGYEGKFSVQFCVVAAILYGEVTLNTFSEEMVTRRNIRKLMSKVQVLADTSFPEGPPELARIEIRIKDRTTYSMQIRTSFMSKKEVKEKFQTLALPRVGRERVDRIVGIVANLEKLHDVNELTSLVY